MVLSKFSKLRKLLPIKGVIFNRFLYLVLSLASMRAKISCKLQFNSSERNLCALAVVFPNIKNCAGFGLSNNFSKFDDDVLEILVTRTLLDYLGILLSTRIPFPRPHYLGAAGEINISCLPKQTYAQIDGEELVINSSVIKVVLKGVVPVLSFV